MYRYLIEQATVDRTELLDETDLDRLRALGYLAPKSAPGDSDASPPAPDSAPGESEKP